MRISDCQEEWAGLVVSKHCCRSCGQRPGPCGRHARPRSPCLDVEFEAERSLLPNVSSPNSPSPHSTFPEDAILGSGLPKLARNKGTRGERTIRDKRRTTSNGKGSHKSISIRNVCIRYNRL